MATTSSTPVEDLIRLKINAALEPTKLEICNNSASHSHHQAMAGSNATETHFELNIVSDAFTSKKQRDRHRMVYALLQDELNRPGGIHALQLRTQTTEEENNKGGRKDDIVAHIKDQE